MPPATPADALGTHADTAKQLIIDVIQRRHALAADAHEVAETRYGLVFGTQWRDLLADACEAFAAHGYQTQKVRPASHSFPVVNNCLLRTWRVPEQPNPVENFASSATRLNGFSTPPPPQTLFDLDPELNGADDPAADVEPLSSVVLEVDDMMPLVLVMIASTPRQLLCIEWAVAALDEVGKVNLRGREVIWQPELIADSAAPEVESFDSGTPATPVVALQAQEDPKTDA